MSKHPKPGGGRPYPNPNDHCTNEQKRSISGDVHVRGEVAVELGPKGTAARDSSETKEDARHRENLRLNRWTLAILVIYATLTGFQWLASKKSADTARDALIQVQRAFMAANILDISREMKDGKVDSVYFVVRWKNNGTTPTKNLLIHHNYMNGLPPSNFSFPDLWNPGEPQKETPSFASSQAVISPVPIIIPIATVKTVADGKNVITFWGHADYRDIFKETPNHHAEYCFIVFGFYGDPTSTNPTDSLIPMTKNCDAHNCQDEECKVK